MSEEAGDVFGAQGVVEDGAADGLLQDAEQDQLLIDLQGDGGVVRREEEEGGDEEEEETRRRRTPDLDDGLGDEGVEVRHQFAVDVGHVQVLRDDGDEAHRPVPDPQVGVTQERSYGSPDGTNITFFC